MKPHIPRPVIAVVADELASHYTHTQLNTMFIEHGAPGDPPEGSKVVKCQEWLKLVSADSTIDPLGILGRLLELYMDVDAADMREATQVAGRVRIREVLGKCGLRYAQGGQVLGVGTSTPARTLLAIVRQRDLSSIEVEFQRAMEAVESDPPRALTAACAILEAFFDVYIEERGLTAPAERSIKPMWKVVQADLGLAPAGLQQEDKDLVTILGGMAAVVDGIGALRTHAGSAHGRSGKRYRVLPRHARLAVNAAHTLLTFLLETWDSKA